MPGSSDELGEQDQHLGSKHLPYYYRFICFGDYSIPYHAYLWPGQTEDDERGVLHFPQKGKTNIKGKPCGLKGPSINEVILNCGLKLTDKHLSFLFINTEGI